VGVERLEFAEGSVEIDLKGMGKSEPSFLGVALSVVDGKRLRPSTSGRSTLVVDRLTSRANGKVGLWADSREGAFRNLKIRPAK
jgi:hypothetical protein